MRVLIAAFLVLNGCATEVVDEVDFSLPTDSGRAETLPNGQVPDRAAQPILSISPQWPMECGRPDTRHRVDVQFSVDENGRTYGAEILLTTNSCFNQVSVNSVGRWGFPQKVVDGLLEHRHGVVASFIFDGRTEEKVAQTCAGAVSAEELYCRAWESGSKYDPYYRPYIIKYPYQS